MAFVELREKSKCPFDCLKKPNRTLKKGVCAMPQSVFEGKDLFNGAPVSRMSGAGAVVVAIGVFICL
jgi:hypothetical protein